MTTKTVQDYYSLLDIMPNATQEEVRQAYRRVARTCHPDISTAPDAEERFKELNIAYEILADPAKRKVYDSVTVNSGPIPTPPVTPPSESVSPPPYTGTASVANGPTTFTTPRTTTSNTAKKRSTRQPYPPTWAILLIMLGLCIIVSVTAAAVRSLFPLTRPAGSAETLSVSKLATFNSPPTVPAHQAVIQENGTPLLTVLPNHLDLAGHTFSVIPVTPEQGRWPVPEQQVDIGVWVHGTVVNYVIGLPYTATTESILQAMDTGARITLTLDNGTALVFGAPQSQRIAADDMTPMSQLTPGLTLVLLGNHQTNRLIVRARYLPEESVASHNTQRVDGVLVEVLKSGVVDEIGDTRYFVVEYRVTNETTRPLTPSFFDMSLESGAGQRYSPNAEASAKGENGPLQTEIATGAMAQGSSGYLIPRDTSPPLTWIFRADPNSANESRTVLPYEKPIPTPAQPLVDLTSVFADGTRNVIVVNGTLHNIGETALTITLEDMTLSSGIGSSSLSASTPLLPWTIAGNDTQSFELQFSRPNNVASLLLDILGFTFQIDASP